MNLPKLKISWFHILQSMRCTNMSEHSFEDRQSLIEFLKTNKKYETEEDIAKHLAVVNTKQKVIGVPMAVARKVAKEILKGDYKKFLEEAKQQNSKDEYYEETLIQGLVIAGIKDIDEMIQNLEWWCEKIDSWAHVDSVCSTMKSLKKCNNKDKYFDYFYEMCFSDKEFVARLGIITLMCNFLEEKYIDQILNMCEKVTNDAFYVQMGLAWLLSVSFVKFREKTFELIKRKVLSKFVQNKTISKCHDSFRVTAEDKAELKKHRK